MTASRSRARIIVADDHAIVREGLQMRLQAEPAFQVLEVVLHLVGGLSNKEIAQTLSLSEDAIN